MKKVLFIAIIVTACVTFAACNSCNIEEPPITTGTDSPTDKDATPATTTTTTAKAPSIGNATPQAPINDDGTGIFFMGMSADSFKAKVEELGWSCDEADYGEPSPSSQYYVNFPDENRIYFVFEDNQLAYINVSTDGIETEKGLKIGDSESKIKKLYGQPTNYIPWEEGFASYYYYTNGGITLCIEVSHNTKKVTQWQLGLIEYIQ